MTVFFAKPDQTYREHLDYVYTAWKQTISAMRPLIERFAFHCGFTYDEVVSASLLTIALHDVGKMITPFQEMMETIRAGAHYDTRRNYRHELVSFLYVASQREHLKDSCAPLILLGALAVAGHHRSLNSDLTSFERERMATKRRDPPPYHLPAGIREALDVAEELFELEGGHMHFGEEERLQHADPYANVEAMVPYIHTYVVQQGVERSRLIYALLKGILHYADWHGSGMAPVSYALTTGPETVTRSLRVRCEAKGNPYRGLNPFQRTCGECDGNVILSAPTGSGKTEAALLWALSNASGMGGAKVLYLLPTMVTANSTWQRLTEAFGNENVGLTHSTASLFKSDEASSRGEAEADQWANRGTYLFDQTFIRPVTVATIDQLLTTGFNSGRWTVKEVNAANAVIVIDEVHAYEPWTMGLLVATIRHFSQLGSRFLLMSATLPSHIRSLLLTELTSATLIEDDTLVGERRSTYYVKHKHIEDDLGTISRAVLEGRRVLVVVNTVQACQALTEALGELNPLCYHSRFTLNDRKHIEAEIPLARLLVATQVVEVSLDIDFDWLFTECAPADALVQRAGRVNRRRDSNRDSRVYIYKASKKAELVYGSEQVYDPITNASLIEATYAAFEEACPAITEGHLLRIVEAVYRNYHVEDEEHFIEATQLYESVHNKRAGIFDSRLDEEEELTTRLGVYETTPVIPLCYENEVLNLRPADRRWFEVKLPLWYVKQHRCEIDGITFCDVKYDGTLGALLK